MTQRVTDHRPKVEAPKASAARSSAPKPAAKNEMVIPRERLHVGSSGTRVANLQRQLKHAGFHPGAIDGEFGPHTKKALEAFQAKHNIPVDGVASPKVWKALGGEKGPIPGTLKEGAQGLHVKDLQRELKRAGFNPGPTDGIFGPHTKAAVQAFQKAHGLTPTGNAGEHVWQKLGGDRYIGAHPRHAGGSRGPGDAPSVGGGGPPGEVSETMRRLGQAGINAAMGMGGYTSHGLCATGVSRAIENAMGIHVGGNGNQIDDNLPRDKFREVNMPLSEALKRPGMVLTWEHTSTRLGSIYGHTAITTGDGHSSCSDFIERDTLAGAQSRTGLKIFEPIV
jgi:peptidoglycan hydrolase-like protein with peptidoglycan-binding domain